MRCSASIVIGKPLPKIARYAEIPLVRMIYASKNINIFHAFYSAIFSTSCVACGKVRVFSS